jgi:Ca-activated chloride channel family protein
MRQHARSVSLSSLAFVVGTLSVIATGVGCGGGGAGGMYPMSPPREAAYGGVVVADPSPGEASTEQYTDYGVNPMKDASKSPLSTFAVDVDTASFSIVRRMLHEGRTPPKEAVRAEEFLNAFDYGYDGPKSQSDAPFAIHLAAAPSPYDQGHTLVRVALEGKKVSGAERKAVHLVYLVDTSGSMMSPDKIDLAKKSLHLLTDALHQGDTVALCTYAGSVRKVLDPTGVEKKQQIHAAIDQLTAEGSTAMASGIDLAYSLAHMTLTKGPAGSPSGTAGDVNRVVVLSDGDANVGTSNWEEMYKSIEQYKDEGITLSTVGFGNGNYKDTTMEQLADKGDGNYSYIDSDAQAKHVFVDQLDGLLQVIARDVKVQVQFDPEEVESWRLIGYENRAVADKDFANDKVDGGEIGAGHSVTALYDVVMKKSANGATSGKSEASPLKVSLRWKKPLGNEPSKESTEALEPSEIAKSFDATDARFRLAVAVAGFAEVLRQSDYAKNWSLDTVASIAKTAKVDAGEQEELMQLIALAKTKK